MVPSSAAIGTLLFGRRVVIIVTTGTMLPFDRLIRAMDRWAEQHLQEEVFAQIGDGDYTPKNMHWARFLVPGEFADRVRRSSLIVAHAGTGSYFLAAETSKAVVMLPRLAVNREHTTDHQVHTARWLSNKPGVYVAMTEEDLPAVIAKAQAPDGSIASPASEYAPQSFIAEIRKLLLA
jgi:UDP-N-acetylglucosamine transferase subunit ALG13